MPKYLKNLLYLITGKPHASPAQLQNETIRLLLERRSCRSFTNDEIEKETIDTILEAGRFAPSTVNLQTWSFITFSKKDWKEKFGNSMPFKGAYAIIICTDMFKMKDLLPDFNETPFVNNSFALFNAGLAAMNMTLASEALGLRSIMLSETGKTGLLDIRHLKEILALPDAVMPITTLIIGKAGVKMPGIPPRQPKEAVVMNKSYNRDTSPHLNVWFNQMMTGYKVTHPFSTLDKQIAFYRNKMAKAEKEVKKIFGSDDKNV